MARNRKRAKARQARRPQPVPSARADRDEAPEPIAHATPDVELAEAQVALGRPELVEDEETEREASLAEFDREAELAEEDEAELEAERASRAEGPADAHAAPVPARREPGWRVVNFVQGSWRELQRVQWPDRRQVMQATGVVIGFVIIAGVYLGVADALASRVMNFILTGHFK